VFKIPRKAMQNEQILESLVWRKYEPAIKEIECNPDIYSEKLKKAVKNKIYNRFDNLI
jgi:hypothetical protein